jgi:two-component system, NarL family, sensor kinase
LRQWEGFPNQGYVVHLPMKRTEKAGEGAGEAPSTAGAVAKFALAGLAALPLVGVAAFLVMRHIGTSQAVDNAKQVTRVVGRGIVEPQLDAGVLAGRPASIARLDRTVRRRVLGDGIVRVKVWTPSGRIVYSDEPRLIGDHYRLAADDLAVVGGGSVAADVSDLSAPENHFEQRFGKLLEVYLPITATTGRPLLFESYQRFSSVTSSGSSIWLAFAPALIGALILLELVHVPLASTMARRLRRGHREREALLRRALDSSELERRRIASDLHDGVVQRLAGTSYSLAAAAERKDAAGPEASAALREGAAQTRQGVRELRSLLVEIYPASLREAGLERALSDLLAALSGNGVRTSVEFEDGLELSHEREALIFRVAQEAVRNAARHATASSVAVRLVGEDGSVALTIADDGVGFDPDRPSEGANGHFGLRLVTELAADADAAVEIDSARGEGTTVVLRVKR